MNKVPQDETYSSTFSIEENSTVYKGSDVVFLYIKVGLANTHSSCVKTTPKLLVLTPPQLQSACVKDSPPFFF